MLTSWLAFYSGWATILLLVSLWAWKPMLPQWGSVGPTGTCAFLDKAFAQSGHIVQNHICRWASCAVGLPKQRQVQVDWYKLHCFGSATAQLAHQQMWFCTLWPDCAKGLFHPPPLSWKSPGKSALSKQLTVLIVWLAVMLQWLGCGLQMFSFHSVY